VFVLGGASECVITTPIRTIAFSVVERRILLMLSLRTFHLDR
jgi:hypothetical protein